MEQQRELLKHILERMSPLSEAEAGTDDVKSGTAAVGGQEEEVPQPHSQDGGAVKTAAAASETAQPPEPS